MNLKNVKMLTRTWEVEFENARGFCKCEFSDTLLKKRDGRSCTNDVYCYCDIYDPTTGEDIENIQTC